MGVEGEDEGFCGGLGGKGLLNRERGGGWRGEERRGEEGLTAAADWIREALDLSMIFCLFLFLGRGACLVWMVDGDDDCWFRGWRLLFVLLVWERFLLMVSSGCGAKCTRRRSSVLWFLLGVCEQEEGCLIDVCAYQDAVSWSFVVAACS